MLKGKTKSVCSKVNEKVQNTTLEKWVFKEEKIKPISSKPIYTFFFPNQSHCALTILGEDIEKVQV